MAFIFSSFTPLACLKRVVLVLVSGDRNSTDHLMTYRRRRAAGNGGRHSSRRSRSSHRSRSGGGRRQGTPGRSPTRSRRSRSDATAEVEVRGSHQVGCWPHSQSFLFASLGVVIGMFSISRFVVLTIDFGGENSAPHPPSLPYRAGLGGAQG